MDELAEVAPAFIEMAHRIVWCSAATVDGQGRPRSRILHPIWQWDDRKLIGWVGTSPTPIKRAHLEKHPYMSMSYWSPSHDNVVADCRAKLIFDDDTRTMVWNLFVHAEPPAGYDPAIVPAWKSPTSEAFAVVHLEPWRLRVFPGRVLLGQGGQVLNWQQ